MKSASALVLVALAAVALLAPGALAQCPETLSQGSTPNDAYLGLHPVGQRYGVGEMVTLVCDNRLETVEFRIGWGPAVGDVRSLTTGDTLFCEVRRGTTDVVAVAHTLIPEASGLRYLSFDFLPQDVLIPADDYLFLCYTRADAAGGASYCGSCDVGSTRYTSSNSMVTNSWMATTGNLAYTINLDWDVTPTETGTWGAVRRLYR